MAVQMHIAYSEFIGGCGVFAGGPYGCALGINNTTSCHGAANMTQLIDLTDSLADSGQISNPIYLDGAKVYFFSGTNDPLVPQEAVEQNKDLYEHYSANVSSKFDIDSGHGIPRVDYGVVCNTTQKPYINK